VNDEVLVVVSALPITNEFEDGENEVTESEVPAPDLVEVVTPVVL
jgi:hypothetical protein